jgi:GNAT superfamily N-acetyltransferase
MAEPERGFEEAIRVLRPGGTLVVTEPKQSIQMDMILSEVERQLEGKGLEADYQRVFHANSQFKKKFEQERHSRQESRHPRYWSEIVLQRLKERGFQGLETIDSHFGQCQTVIGRKPALRLRLAAGDDATKISTLYEQAYTAKTTGDAKDHYPYPQLLDPNQLPTLIAKPNICWIVAEMGDDLIGSAAAQRNIGTDNDRVSEVFGIVVDKSHQRKKYGRELLNRLCDELGDGAGFVICEARTAGGGWKLAKTCGFYPLGFEPYAHHTPAGFETMLLTGKPPKTRSSQAVVSSQAKTLARCVLSVCGLPAPTVEDAEPFLTKDCRWKDLPGNTSHRSPAESAGIAPPPPESPVEVRRDDAKGQTLIEDWRERGLHQSGVVGLCRLEGRDVKSERYRREFHVATVGNCDVGSLRMDWDRLDRRARILEMQVVMDGVQGVLIAQALSSLVTQEKSRPFVLVVDVRADALHLHATLSGLRFFPTVYYPGLIADRNTRADAVQFTYLTKRRNHWRKSGLKSLAWPDAEDVFKSVR